MDDDGFCGLRPLRAGRSGWVGVMRGASRGAAVRADNWVSAAGAASLAPSLGGMTQLTTLNLSGTLSDIGGSWCCERVLASAGCAMMMLRVVGWGGYALGRSGWWGLRGASRGTAVRADNQIGAAGAASLAPSLGVMTQLTSLNLNSTLRASAGSCAVGGCLRTPAVRGCCCMLRAVG